MARTKKALKQDFNTRNLNCFGIIIAEDPHEKHDKGGRLLAHRLYEAFSGWVSHATGNEAIHFQEDGLPQKYVRDQLKEFFKTHTAETYGENTKARISMVLRQIHTIPVKGL